MTRLPPSNVVVVGAGITGCYAAYFLASLGLAPTLIERAGVGNQASGTNPGGLFPLHGAGIPGPMSSLAMASLGLHLEHREAIEQLSGVRAGPHSVSRVALALDERDLVALRHSLKLHEAAEGFSAHWLDQKQLLEMEPRLSPSVIRGLRTEGNAEVDSQRYTEAVARAAVKLGARLVSGSVIGLKRLGARATGVVLDSGEMACGALVLATGPWVADPARWLGVPIPVEPVKGELLLARLPGAAVQESLTWRHAGLYCRADGSALLGGTETLAGFDLTPSETGRQAIVADVGRIMPAIRDAELTGHVAALRPVTPDGLPVVGRPPGWENVFVATGAGRKGMLLSAGVGSAVAAEIAGEASLLDIGPCAFERFSTPPEHNMVRGTGS
jgi:glycine oxidase